MIKICVAINLAEDGREWAAYSFDYPLVEIYDFSN